MTAPLYVLLLDGGDRHVVNELMNAGRLPAVARLRARGAAVRLPTLGEAMEEAVCPALLAGQRLGDVGTTHFHSFESSTMGIRFEREAEVEPFWLHLPDRGAGVRVLDTPQVHPHPDARAEHVCGWNMFSPPHRTAYSHPALRRRLPPVDDTITEFDHPPTLDDERTLSRRLERGAAQRGQAARTFVDGARALVLGVHETHAAVHMLGHHWVADHWHRPASPDPELVTRPYEAIDAALAPLIDDPRANVVVVMWHGIRPANPIDHLLEELLVRAGYTARWNEGGVTATGQGRRPLTDRLRDLVPASWRERVAMAVLPDSAQHALASRRFRDTYDWSRTTAFPVPTWTSGFVRINLRGREAEGIVDPTDLERVLDDLTALLAATTDADTGAPLVGRVFRAAVDLPGARSHLIPDLVFVGAADRPVQRASHPELGTWSAEPPIHRYRFSLHSNGGLAFFGGPDVRAIDAVLDGDTIDLAPTLLALGGVRPPSSMPGAIWHEVLAG